MATPFSLTKLKDEIVNDPQVIGFKNSAVATDWKGDQVIADLINAQDGPPPVYTVSLRRMLMSPEELLTNIDFSEYSAFTAAERAYIAGLLRLEVIDTDKQEVFDALAGDIFTNVKAPNTRTNLLAILQYTGSRAQELWGEATAVSVGQVGAAFNLI